MRAFVSTPSREVLHPHPLPRQGHFAASVPREEKNSFKFKENTADLMRSSTGTAQYKGGSMVKSINTFCGVLLDKDNIPRRNRY